MRAKPARLFLRTLVTAVVLLLCIAGWFGWRYRSLDVEASDLDDAARKTASGSFAPISSGLVHYELAGPPDAPAVVLIHGFSVPGYLWDPVFKALTEAGFRVLR